jgi:hypothetical protein
MFYVMSNHGPQQEQVFSAASASLRLMMALQYNVFTIIDTVDRPAANAVAYQA